jgi:thiol-disulfide isomerase/thioredoxin
LRLSSTLSLFVVACGAPPASAPAAPNAAPSSGNQADATRQHDGLEWFEDEPAAAFAAAGARRQLLFADLWAPWCHTCLSMRHEVLRPDTLPELSKVVLLSIDTERAQNEAFLQTYPVTVWPTFYLLDAQTREVRGRWLGGASPTQLRRWLQDSASGSVGPLQLLREADTLATKKSFAEAAPRYRAALAAAPPGWPRRPDALVALISALLKLRDYDACLQLALAEGQTLPPSVSAVDFASVAESCAEHAPSDAKAAQVQQLVEGLLARDCEATAPGASADDQADACDNLRRVRQALGNPSGARRAANRTLAVIAAASNGGAQETQLIYDWARTSSLVYLGRSQEAISLLVERERALPESYNPPHYLARLYRDLGQWQLGLSAVERALGKAYGPRHASLLGLKAELLQGDGRADDARNVLQAQLAEYRALPTGQQQPDAEAAVEARLAGNASGAPPPASH